MQPGVMTLVTALVACLAPAGTAAETMRCSASEVLITGGDAGTRQRVCETIWREAPRLADCNVPIPEEIELRILPELPDEYFALSHVNLALIEILSPDLMAEVRRPEHAVAIVPDAEFFDSIVVHELTHAAYTRLRCPFRSCVATAEFASSVMQLRSFPNDIRAAFEAAPSFDRKIAREELNATYYALAPDRFAQKAWLYFAQQEDGCELIGKIMSGEVFFDGDPD